MKPFSPTELAARIRAALRQQAAIRPPDPREPYEFRELSVNYAQRRATLASHPIRLTNVEFRLNASDPTYIFTETRTGYRMAKT